MKQETEDWRAAEKKQYEKMTETPVSKLIIMLGIPTTISMLVTNIYNMADTYFVGELGTSASGAVGVVFGLMAIIQAFEGCRERHAVCVDLVCERAGCRRIDYGIGTFVSRTADALVGKYGHDSAVCKDVCHLHSDCGAVYGEQLRDE